MGVLRIHLFNEDKKKKNRVEGRASGCSQQVIHCRTPKGTTFTASSDGISEWMEKREYMRAVLKLHGGCRIHLEPQKANTKF